MNFYIYRVGSYLFHMNLANGDHSSGVENGEASADLPVCKSTPINERGVTRGPRADGLLSTADGAGNDSQPDSSPSIKMTMTV